LSFGTNGGRYWGELAKLESPGKKFLEWRCCTATDCCYAGAVIRNVSAKPTVFMTANETGAMSVTASAAASTAAMKPYVVAAVVDPSEV